MGKKNRRRWKGPGSRGGAIGRPRQHRPLKDLGTPELIAKRVALVGKENLTLASYPLGVLLARKIITEDQHDAGGYYAYLYGRVLGKIHPGPAGEGAYEQFGDDEAQEVIESLWRDAGDILKAVSSAAKKRVDNVAVYQRLPDFLFKDNRSASQSLIDGLTSLAEWRIRGRMKVE